MTPDWTALAPGRPLDGGDSRYLPPPKRTGEEIADRVLAGTRTLLVGGPAGVAKSTELPLPSLSPAALLAWLMSQVVPTLAFEPASWPAVNMALQKVEN